MKGYSKLLLLFGAIVFFWVSNAGSQSTSQSTDSTQAGQTQSLGTDEGQKDEGQKSEAHDHMHHMEGMNDQDSSITGMKMGADDIHVQPTSLLEAIEHHSVSGTDLEPISTPSSMLMSMKGNWMLMLHGAAFVSDIQQSGPRGADKLFSTNWIMPMAQRNFGGSTLTLRTMLSLEPATVSDRFYPELFQQGETAFGKPIVDGQHPHNFFMEIAALYDMKIGEKTLLSFYAAPVGDPAMGPPAYPHRISASEDPIAPLGHHLQDSTHIAYEVVTVGITSGIARIEASGFHGREPAENRWTVYTGKIDSWSTRLTVNPGRNWSAQYSFAHLSSPEALQPLDDIDRMTASVMYNRQFAKGNWASLLVWGRNKNQPSGLVWNSYLAESTLRFAGSNNIWGRFENVDRTSELFFKNLVEPANFAENILGRVQAYSIGYDRDMKVAPHLATAIGAQATFYGVPETLQPIYGSHPVGVVMFARFRLVPKEH